MNVDLEIFADYFQFYLQDENASGELDDAWTDEALGRMLAVGKNAVGIGTVRNMPVPVRVEVLRSEPEDDPNAWDHVVDASIEIPSGRIVVAGGSEYYPSARRIDVRPGAYQLRAYYGKLGTLRDNDLAGDDHYRVVLWPGALRPVQVIKQWSAAPAGAAPGA